MKRWALAGVFAVAAACGGEVAHRSLEIEVRGLSARAERLVLKLIPAPQLVGCGTLKLADVPEVSGGIELIWERASGAPRLLEAPLIEAEAMTVVGHSEDAAGRPIQMVCVHLEYAELGELPAGLLILSLSQRNSDP